MKWTKISAIIGTVLLVTALTLKLAGYGTKSKISETEVIIHETALEPNEIIILEITADYDIVIQEPNHLVVELWDTSGWYINREDSDIIVTNRRRVEINIPYLIVKQEPGYLRVDPPEPNEPNSAITFTSYGETLGQLKWNEEKECWEDD